MMHATKLAGFIDTSVQPAVNKARPTRRAISDFTAALRAQQQSAAETSQSNGGNTSVPTVIVSPFNPLGLPVSTTPAPTAAEVAANPERWKGTSFDPALRVIPYQLS